MIRIRKAMTHYLGVVLDGILRTSSPVGWTWGRP